MRWLVFLFVLLGCTTRTVKDASAPRASLFPDGSYQHEVSLKLKSGQAFHFSGAVQIHRPALSLAGFSPLGTTLFRITDDGVNPVKTEIYTDRLKPYENRMRDFYGTLKSLLEAPASSAKEMDLATPTGPAHLTFEHYDKNQVPDEIEVKSEPFNLHIKVVSYEI